MKDLLLSNYFWFYAVAWFFTWMCQRSSKNFNGSSETARFILRTVSYVGVLASLAFTITAICILPHWWMALVMWVLCFLASQLISTLTIFIPDIILGITGIIATPAFYGLAFFYLCR